MKKIIDWFGGSVIKDLMSGLDKLFTSKEEKIIAENAIKQILLQKQLELQKMQTDVIITEAKGNWLQRSWRPILMMSFGFIVIYVKFIGPLLAALTAIFGIITTVQQAKSYSHTLMSSLCMVT